MSIWDNHEPTPINMCDCEGRQSMSRFMVTDTKYTCEWDDIHLIKEMKSN